MAQKEQQKTSGGLVTILFILIFLMIGAVGYLFYQVNGHETESTIASIFYGKKEEKLFPLDEFTLQLADGRYAKVSLSIGYMSSRDKDLEEYKATTPILRDKVITELMQMTSEQLGVKEIEVTKKVLVNQLSPLITQSEIKNIYVESLVVQ